MAPALRQRLETAASGAPISPQPPPVERPSSRGTNPATASLAHEPPPALLLTRLFIIFQEAVAGRRRQPMESAAVLTAERRRPMGDEGGSRRSRAALEHDIICLHAAAKLGAGGSRREAGLCEGAGLC